MSSSREQSSQSPTPPSGDKDKSRARTTRLVHAGRDLSAHGFVNPPVYRGSTVLADSLSAYESGAMDYTYGLHQSPTFDALKNALLEIERGDVCVIVPSGLSAVTLPFLALLSAGDHVLISDGVYGPTRRFLARTMKRFGIAHTYFDPMADPNALEALIRPETRLLYLESPASYTMEVQDVPALVEFARKHGLFTAMDNTWSAGWFFDPFAVGVDVSIQAATKYQAGHSDVLIGAVLAIGEAAERIAETHGDLGLSTGPDDVWLTLRGLRTLEVRLSRHQENALKVAEWLRGQEAVARVLHPALPDAPGHELFQRDFSGSSGLFSIILKPVSEEALHAFVDGLELFGIGASWGGYESLILRFDPASPRLRTARPWQDAGPLLRLHIGLEDPDDLIADLDAGLRRLKEA